LKVRCTRSQLGGAMGGWWVAVSASCGWGYCSEDWLGCRPCLA